MSVTIVEYQNREELHYAHPEIKNFMMVLQVRPGQPFEEVLVALLKKKTEGRLYRVGNFIWKAAETTPRIGAISNVTH